MLVAYYYFFFGTVTLPCSCSRILLWFHGRVMMFVRYDLVCSTDPIVIADALLVVVACCWDDVDVVVEYLRVAVAVDPLC